MNKFLFLLPLIIYFTACGETQQGSKEVVSQINNNPIETTQTSTGKTLYKVCAGCHGLDGEITALEKSDIIGGQAIETTKYQLKEYRAKRLNQYGFGSVMAGQTQISDNKINLLAEYISTLSGIKRHQIDNTQGKELFDKCTGCHGQQGEKVAIGESLVIRNMSKPEILTALKGYKDKTYGRSLKGLMTIQVKDLTISELEVLANYISKL
jgi:cytochrome c553